MSRAGTLNRTDVLSRWLTKPQEKKENESFQVKCITRQFNCWVRAVLRACFSCRSFFFRVWFRSLIHLLLALDNDNVNAPIRWNVVNVHLMGNLNIINKVLQCSKWEWVGSVTETVIKTRHTHSLEWWWRRPDNDTINITPGFTDIGEKETASSHYEIQF